MNHDQDAAPTHVNELFTNDEDDDNDPEAALD